MSNTSESSPTTVKEPELSSLFVAFWWAGFDNGVRKEGFDSRVIKAPIDVKIASAEDIKAIADAIAETEFKGDRRYVGLETVVMNLQRLPV